MTVGEFMLWTYIVSAVVVGFVITYKHEHIEANYLTAAAKLGKEPTNVGRFLHMSGALLVVLAPLINTLAAFSYIIGVLITGKLK